MRKHYYLHQQQPTVTRKRKYRSTTFLVCAFIGVYGLFLFEQRFREQVTTALISLCEFLGGTPAQMGPFLLVALEGFWTVLNRSVPFLLGILKATVTMVGAIVKVVGSVGLVLLVAAFMVALMIAQPTLQEIGEDLRNDLQQHYKSHKRMQRKDQEGLIW